MNKQLKLKINGVMTTVKLPNGLKPAHGVGFDGKTKVQSLKYGKSDHAGSGSDIGGEDSHGNPFMTTADEILALAQNVGRDFGYQVTVTKL